MILLKNTRIVAADSSLENVEILIKNGKIAEISKKIQANADIYDLNNAVVIGGAVDVHVHLRQPGYEYKEDISSATMAAAKGGITTLFAMPNLNPVPDCIENLEYINTLISKSAHVDVHQLCSITKGQKGCQLSDIDKLAAHTKAFSDDGVGIDDLDLLKQAMLKVKTNGLIIASHAENKYAADSEQAEIEAVKREIDLVRQTKCKYHFCHLSLQKSFDLVENAQKEGLDITCEVTPHHLFLCSDDIKDANYKMNPPLRSRPDMLATQTALLNGVASIIATDHAPHASHEKQDYNLALNGIIGLETMIPLVYTNLVKQNRATLNDLINWFCINPAKRFGLPINAINEGNNATLTAIDIDNNRIYQKNEILSKSKNSPFINSRLFGFSILTLKDGNIIYNNIGGKNYEQTNASS